MKQQSGRGKSKPGQSRIRFTIERRKSKLRRKLRKENGLQKGTEGGD